MCEAFLKKLEIEDNYASPCDAEGQSEPATLDCADAQPELSCWPYS